MVFLSCFNSLSCWIIKTYISLVCVCVCVINRTISYSPCLTHPTIKEKRQGEQQPMEKKISTTFNKIHFD